MTSKNLFFKFLRQEKKNNIWYPLTVFILLFLVMEVPLIMKIDDITNWPKRYQYDVKHYFANNFLSTDTNYLLTGITCGLAVLTAFIMFSFVHSKTKLDLLHSIPVKRRTIFLVKYICGYVFFAVPFVLQMLLTFVIASVKNCFSIHAVNNVIMYLITLSIIYMAVYSMTIIAIMLTGNIVISMIATVILQFYSLAISLLRMNLYERFFSTAIGEYIEPIITFSPLDIVYTINTKFADYREINSGISYRVVFPYILFVLLIAIVYSVAACVLYSYRKSEACGNAIAFPYFEPIIKFIVLIPLTVYAGGFFEDISESNRFTWFVFGALATFLISSIAIEIIFRFDFKAGLNNWHHILFNGICVVLIITIFKTDVLGYNTYVPSRKEISYISVSIDDLYAINTRNIGGGMHWYTDYRMQNVKLYDEDTYNFAIFLAKQGLKYDYSSNSQQYLESEEYKAIKEKEKNYHTISYGFHLSNGKTIYRQYVYDISDERTKDIVSAIFDSKEYKIGSIPLIKYGWSKNITAIDADSNYYNDTVGFSEKEKNQFLDCYQSEIMNLSFDEVLNVKPAGAFSLIYEVDNSNFYEGGYPIYPSFKNTIAFLEGKGLSFDKDDFVKRITKASIVYYDDEKTIDGEYPEVSFTQPEIIEDLLDKGISYNCCNSFIINYRHEFDIDFCYYDEDGDKNYKYMRFYDENIPEYVLNALDLD